MELIDQEQDQARMDRTYQSTTYRDNRKKKRSLFIDVKVGTGTTFSETLSEPLIIDTLADIYLDSFMTFDAKVNSASSGMGFILNIDQFDIHVAGQNANIFDKIYIPNDTTATGAATVHKGKKFNYICSINPAKLYKLTGSITDCPISGAPVSNYNSSDGRFIAEFMIVDRVSPDSEGSGGSGGGMEIYQAPSYRFERLTQKSLVIDHNIESPDRVFTVKLQEPLIIDVLSDIYLDSFTTFKAYVNAYSNNSTGMAFILGIDQFNIHSTSTNPKMYNKILIPNEETTATGNRTRTHKGRKMNFICSINPTTLSTISGTIARAPHREYATGGSPEEFEATISEHPYPAFDSGGRFIAEFLIVAR